MAKEIDPGEVARKYRSELRAQLAELSQPLTLVGFLSTDAAPSRAYAEYTRAGCADVGIRFDLREVDRLGLENAIEAANADPAVHGIMAYYPIFGLDRDRYLKDLVDPGKDVEGLTSHWAHKLYRNERFADPEKTKPAILPCTPLAILKLLAAADCAPAGKKVVVFNRSEVVGRPLARMLANDGAEVISFDVDGARRFEAAREVETTTTRREALAAAEVVITGVPSRDFPLVSARELRAGAVCVNFSTLKNFADDIGEVAGVFVPRVGPMTVAMALRNVLRLFEGFHRSTGARR
jgi:methylenetetrahydrofolate dehydrogenase (NADP+)/methenyltetrahydrofolate cyclohydrolase